MEDLFVLKYLRESDDNHGPIIGLERCIPTPKWPSFNQEDVADYGSFFYRGPIDGHFTLHGHIDDIIFGVAHSREEAERRIHEEARKYAKREADKSKLRLVDVTRREAESLLEK